MKRRILKDQLIPYRCAECSAEAVWRNKELSLVLDHVNGISDDNRLENLRFLCPNCNSQTDTFAGKANRLPEEERNKRRKRRSQKSRMRLVCSSCGDKANVRSKSGLCRKCYLCSIRGLHSGTCKTATHPCSECGNSCSYRADLCRKCFLLTVTKVKSDELYPPHQELQSLVDEKGYSAVGRMLGVSDNAVRKRLKKAQMA